MNRRGFLALAGMAATAGVPLWQPDARAAALAAAQSGAGYGNVLILVELKGGNDGLNTVVPYADPLYYTLRRNIGIRRDRVLQLDERAGLHPALAPLLPLWRDRQLAIVQGIGYPQPNLSHFRSIEIWDTASRSDQYLRDGWLTRTFAQTPVPANFAAAGVVLGSAEMGPLSNGARAIALVNSAQSMRASRLAEPVAVRGENPACARIVDVGNDIAEAVDRLRSRGGMRAFTTAFPSGAFGASVKTAMQVLAACETPGMTPRNGVAVLRLTLNGFDTHQNQPARQAALLEQLAEGMSAMRAALIELGRWNETLVMTYAEFGRGARENPRNGTDHGTAAPHFLMGGRVAGGLYGEPPALGRLDGNGNLPVPVDFRQLYATVLGPWWGLDPAHVLQQRFEPLPLLRV